MIGIDLGGTKISGALFSYDGEFINKAETLLGGKGGADAGSLVVHQVMKQAAFAMDNQYHVDFIGICVPGISNKTNNTVWAPNIPGWEKCGRGVRKVATMLFLWPLGPE